MAEISPSDDRPSKSVYPISYGPASRSRSHLILRILRVAASLAVLAVVVTIALRRLRAAPPTAPAAPVPLFSAPAPTTARANLPRESERVRITRAYKQDVLPLLDRYDARNHAAADRAIRTLQERIDVHRAGVKPFIKDVQSWGTTFGVIGRKTREVWRRWWNQETNAGSVREYVDAKFRQHVLSPVALERDVQVALIGFREDVEASRNQLYSELRLPLQDIRVDQAQTAEGFAAFIDSIREQSAEMGKSASGDAVVSNLTSFIAGWVAADVGTAVGGRVTAAIMARVGTQLAARAAFSGSATVAGATAGGGTGSLAGPAGTVVGVGIGLAVGAAVDWWMSSEFQEKMTLQLNGFLTDLQSTLIEGNAKEAGLRKSFDQAIRTNSELQRNAIVETLLKDVND